MRIVFIGAGEIGVPTLQALLKSAHEVVGVVTQPDKPVGRSQLIEPSPIKKALSGTEIAVLQPARIKDRQAIEEIRALKPDVIVVMAYGQILPRGVLEIPKIACLNLHASLLPRWRGAAPIQAAIAAGDHSTGITVMYMDEGLDTGDILLQRTINILPGDTGGALHDRVAGVAPETLLESLDLLAKEKAPRTPQDNGLATYAPKLKREDGKIDWSEPAEVIERKIRAFNPWPGAFMKLDGRNLKMFSASVVDLSGKPGEILRSEKQL
ncbi:MAG TPA: methionyl-tRNA formyltransferase, partial [Candidatus Binatia bacterium]|nr:methionyl-tRNA formyltransferase [Candidatus Binatia bacterium]